MGALMFLVIGLLILRKDPFGNRLILYLMVLAGVLAVYILESGWVMAETARQPWIVYNVMTVSQAADYSESGLPILIVLIIFYATVLPFTIIFLRRRFSKRPLLDELNA